MSRGRIIAICSILIVAILLIALAINTVLSSAIQNNPGFLSFFPGRGSTVTTPPPHSSPNWVTRQGETLYLNGQRFRFSGANIYWLGNDENDNHTYPTHFRIDDVIGTAQEMGATVVRSFALESVGEPFSIEPSLGVFNDNGFQSIDYAILSSRNHNIRLVLPLVDNHRGKLVYIAWRGLSNKDVFYTNQMVIQDFEQHISHILNHVNPLTGLAYKDDPTIMAWETGNELRSPTNIWKFDSWTQSIATYIKSIDPRHLVIDGHSAGNRGNQHIQSSSVALTSVDMYSGHYYPMDTNYMLIDANTAHAGNKVFFIGEYDWIGKFQPDPDRTTLTNFLATTLTTNSISGDIFWSLFGHFDKHGFEQHGDHLTLHYPGDNPDMTARDQIIRKHAYAMRGVAVPPSKIPDAPLVYAPRRVTGGVLIDWRGVVAADTYTVQRSIDGITWQTVASGLTDNTAPWIDTTAAPGVAYKYRVIAMNIDRVAGIHSNLVAT
jgi:mannan endo-1,4-beta-mannosidase